MYNINAQKKYDIQLVLPNYGERVRKLLNSKRKNIVYIKNEFDNSTFRYRTVNFEESMENSDKYNITYFKTDEIDQIIRYINNMDLIIMQRTSWNFSIDRLLYLAHSRNIKVVYDVDDLIYHHKYAAEYMNNISNSDSIVDIRFWLGMTTGYEVVAEQCDAYITTTPVLAENLKNDFNKEVYIVPNFYNKEQWEESKYAVTNKQKIENKFMIGYFSGSPSHKNDFKICENEIADLIEKYNNIYLKIVGFLQLSPRLKKLEEKGKVIFEEFVPYQELQSKIASVDLNIIPLADNRFNDCKSELKYFEAGIVKVPSCASPVDIYRRIGSDDIDIVFCEEGKWFEKIENLYLNRKKLNQIAEQAYKKSIKNYSPQALKPIIEDVYDRLLGIKKR